MRCLRTCVVTDLGCLDASFAQLSLILRLGFIGIFLGLFGLGDATFDLGSALIDTAWNFGRKNL